MVIGDFWTSKMATGGHLKKKHLQKSRASDLNNVQTDCWPNTTWYKFTFGQYIYRQVCWERGNIHCVRPLGRMHTILVIYSNSHEKLTKSKIRSSWSRFEHGPESLV